MKKLILGGPLILLMLLLISCARTAAPPPTGAGPQAKAPTQAASQRSGPEATWQQTLDAARQEGKVVIYTTNGAEIRGALAQAVKDKYGLTVEFVTAGGADIVTKVLSEWRAGLYLGDGYLAGTTSAVVMLVPEGVIDKIAPELVLPEVTDVTKWYGNQLPYLDRDQRFVGFRGSPFWAFTINTSLVKPEELVSYNDLLKPEFKGKIAMGDPTITGPANSFATMVSEYLMGPDFIKALVKQEPFVSRDERLLTEWVARGKYSVLIGTKPDPITEFMKAGAPLKPVVPKEGSMIEPGAGTISVMSKRPHPNATRLFVNWLLSKDGQTVYAEAAGIESAREDVSKSHLGAGLVRHPGEKYILGDDDFRQAAAKEVAKSQQDFKPLLGQSR